MCVYFDFIDFFIQLQKKKKEKEQKKYAYNHVYKYTRPQIEYNSCFSSHRYVNM